MVRILGRDSSSASTALESDSPGRLFGGNLTLKGVSVTLMGAIIASGLIDSFG